MRIVKWRSGAECGAGLAIDREVGEVEIDADRFSVMADGAMWLRSQFFAQADTPVRRGQVESETGLRGNESFS